MVAMETDYHRLFQDALAELHDMRCTIRGYSYRFLSANYTADLIEREREKCVAAYECAIGRLDPLPTFCQDFIVAVDQDVEEIKRIVTYRMGLHASEETTYHRIIWHIRRIEELRNEVMKRVQSCQVRVLADGFSEGW